MTTYEGYYNCTEYVCHGPRNFWKGNLVGQALLRQTDTLLQAKLAAKFIPKLWCLSGASKKQNCFRQTEKCRNVKFQLFIRMHADSAASL